MSMSCRAFGCQFDALTADRDQWKARAEAAEADLSCCTSAINDHKKAGDNYRARIAELEAALAAMKGEKP